MNICQRYVLIYNNIQYIKVYICKYNIHHFIKYIVHNQYIQCIKDILYNK